MNGAMERGVRRRAQRGSGAFSLIELLVVVMIISILIAILLPSLGMAKSLGVQLREVAAAQQEMVAFQLYADDHRGHVLPGFPPLEWINDGDADGVVVLNQMGEPIGGLEGQRYPWRLAPYVDYDFRGLYQDDEFLAELQAKDQDDYEYWVSLFPSLGMNTMFVGGDANQGAWNSEMLGLYGRYYVTRMDEARRPTELITFASARYFSQNTGVMRQGFFRVEPPYRLAGEWDESYDPMAEHPGNNSGFVALRHMDRAVTAQMDGHAETLGWDELRDMRRWANGADEADWVLGDD